MKNATLAFTILTLLWTCHSNPIDAIDIDTKAITQEIQTLQTDSLKQVYLEDIYTKDQALRDGSNSEVLNAFGKDSKEYRAAMLEDYQQNRILQVKIDAYLNAYAHPSRYKHGEKAASTPWLVIHHAGDINYRNKHYSTLRKAYRKGHLNEGAFAFYLNRSHTQVFGKRLTMPNPYTSRSEIDSLIKVMDLEEDNPPQIASPLIAADGYQMAFKDEGNGEAVMLLHGFLNTSNNWNNTHLKNQLIINGYRVISPDLRGCGDSQQTHDPKYYSNDAEAKDMVALADYLGLESYRVVGYSRGSIVLAKLLTMDNRISKAVVGGMGLDFSNPDWDRRIAFAQAFGGLAPLTDTTKGAVTYAKSIDADLQILSLQQIYQPVTTPQELAKIQTPMLVIAGDQDTDNGDPKSLANALPNAQLVIVPGDHNTTYRKWPFAEAIMEFLK